MQRAHGIVESETYDGPGGVQTAPIDATSVQGCDVTVRQASEVVADRLCSTIDVERIVKNTRTSHTGLSQIMVGVELTFEPLFYVCRRWPTLTLRRRVRLLHTSFSLSHR